MKLLLVGDPHVVADELPDCERLLDLVEETAVAHPVDGIVFMGDLHHNHAVIALDVMAFWRRRLERLCQRTGLKPYLIVGNHDRSGDGGNPNHALLAYEGLAHIVDTTMSIQAPNTLNEAPSALLVGYTGSEALFAERLSKSMARVVLCHETFNGARYDNGFYAPEGIDPDRHPGREFISGHIHTPQRVGKNVTYIGAPRWRTASDAGVTRRALVLVEVDGSRHKTSHVSILGLISTDTHCRRIAHVVVDEASFEEYTHPPPSGPKYIVDIYGSPDFIKVHSEHWKGARIRTFPTRLDTPVVREAQGINVALGAYLTEYQPQHGASREDLAKLWNDRVLS